MPALWVLKHKIKNESGFPLDFSKRKYQWDMYNDLSPKQATLKPPQVGETVKNLIKSFYVAYNYRKDIIYTLPTDGDVRDMAGGKINRLIAQNPVLKEWIKDHNNVEQKQVGENIIYYRGTRTQTSAMMVSSSLNMHDELDASDPEVITQYETRLEAQEDESKKWRWYFSHPTVAGHGIDVYWQQSDKKEWHIICPHCRSEQYLTWPENIDIEREIYVCKHCSGELQDNDRINGRWINQDGVPWNGTIEGNYAFSGWHISQLMLYNKTAKNIIDSFNDPLKSEQYFYNYTLGLPYVASENKISADAVLKNVTKQVNDQEGRIIIGIDPGLPIHYVCLNQQGVFYYDTCRGYDRIEELLRRWPNSIIVCDQGGDLIGPRELAEKYPGRVFLCYYRKDRKNPSVIQWGKGDLWWTVTVDRNAMIQLIVEQMRDIGRIRLNGSQEDWKEFASHFDNIYREVRVTRDSPGKDDPSLYGTELIWKRNGPDHYVHALLYALVGLDKYGELYAKIATDDDFNDLPTGRIFAEPSNESMVDITANAINNGFEFESDLSERQVEL